MPGPERQVVAVPGEPGTGPGCTGSKPPPKARLQQSQTQQLSSSAVAVTQLKAKGVSGQEAARMARAFEHTKALRAAEHVLRRCLLEMLGRLLVGASSEVDVAQVVHTFWRGVAVAPRSQ